MNFAIADWIAVAVYVGAWLAYHLVADRANARRRGLNHLMNAARGAWMARMGARDPRMVDAQITATLQNGAAFFASTSLLALGGTIGLLRGADDALRVFSELPFAAAPSRALFEAKVVGLAIVLGYAFFKFAWAYRLFNYTAILIGATPPPDEPDAASRAASIERAARMQIAAGRHFARGQRAVFFALAYLGWFLGPVPLVAATLFVLVVMIRRQFSSDARAALIDPPDA
ncbi:MAG: DUF599 family protein [Methylobacteriaceae bacterium]|nr:DUF599 family protein [Methylobacteriaceae bacterium]